LWQARHEVIKSITKRPKEILPYTISKNQSAFTLGCMIVDNILVAFEVFHSMKCHMCLNGSMTIKLDMFRPMTNLGRAFAAGDDGMTF